MNPLSWQRIRFIAYKEMLHILRDPQTLFFTLFLPIAEMFLLGFAINTNVRDVRTVVVDFCRTQESRQLIEPFEKQSRFLGGGRVDERKGATQAIVDGKAQVAITSLPIFPRTWLPARFPLCVVG